jgi:hypothetical protein
MVVDVPEALTDPQALGYIARAVLLLLPVPTSSSELGYQGPPM